MTFPPRPPCNVLRGADVVPPSCRDPPTAGLSTLVADSSRIVPLISDELHGAEVVPRSCRDPPTAGFSTLVADSSRIVHLISESLPPSMDTSTGMTASYIPASSIPSRITLVDGSSRTPRLKEEESILRRSALVVDSPRIGSLPHGFGEDVVAYSGLLTSCCVLLCFESLRIASLPLGFGEDVVAHKSRLVVAHKSRVVRD